MRHVVPVLTVVLAIVVIWYAAAVGLNRAWIYDQAARAGVEPATGMALVVETWNQERPVLPAPHQVVTELVKTTFGMAPTSKRSLVYHGWITLSATLVGFAMGTAMGILLAVGIIHNRAMDMSVMPWAIASQTIPILAIAPMIIVVLNSVGLGAGAEGDHFGLPVVLPSGGWDGEGLAQPRPDAAGPVADLFCQPV